VPFILARIETQKPDSDNRPNRTSIDGQHKLQEEFARKQKDKDAESDDHAANAAIDWGASALVEIIHPLNADRFLGRRHLWYGSPE
jgi:hypothetical protein